MLVLRVTLVYGKCLRKPSQENPQVYPRTQPQPLNNQVQPVLHSAAQPVVQPELSEAQIQAPPRLLVQDHQDPHAEEDKLSVDILDEASLREKQARSELLDRVAKFCDLKRTDSEDTTKVLRMSNSPYHAPVAAPINLALPWHASSVEIAERNHVVTGKLSYIS